MICDENTCPEKYVDEKIYEQHTYDIDEDEFVKNLKHKKCKVIQLVRRQIHKFHDTQLSSVPSEWQRRYMQETRYTSYNVNQEAKVTEDTNKEVTITPGTSLIMGTMLTDQAWYLRTLGKIRRRICVVTLIAGIIVLLMSIYGIYFRAYFCNNGKSCLTSLRYTHVKHALF